jgi:hypothetical protein
MYSSLYSECNFYLYSECDFYLYSECDLKSRPEYRQKDVPLKLLEVPKY